MGIETALLVGTLAASVGGSIASRNGAKSSGAPAGDVEDAARKATNSRARLLATSGGATGEELTPTDTQNRKTLLGN